MEYQLFKFPWLIFKKSIKNLSPNVVISKIYQISVGKRMVFSKFDVPRCNQGKTRFAEMIGACKNCWLSLGC